MRLEPEPAKLSRSSMVMLLKPFYLLMVLIWLCCNDATSAGMGDGTGKTIHHAKESCDAIQFPISFLQHQRNKHLTLMKNTVPRDTALLRKAILQEFSTHPEGVFALAFKDLATGKVFFMNEHLQFHAASTMKTPILIEAYKQAAAGKFNMSDSFLVKNEFRSIVDGSSYSLDSVDDSEHDLYTRIGTKLPLSDLLRRMITMSSNLATNMVVELVGAQNANATMRTLGARDIQVLRGVEDDKAFEKGLNNTTTAYDLMLIMESLALGKAVNRESSDAMIRILMDQHFREKIAGKLPPGVIVASKSGSVTAVSHDSGIVFLPDGRKYVLVLLSKGVQNEAAVNNTLANVSKIIYDFMN